jgi:hypothetical protein
VVTAFWRRFKNFSTEDGGDMFLQNIGNHLQDYTASKPRWPRSTYHKVIFKIKKAGQKHLSIQHILQCVSEKRCVVL